MAVATEVRIPYWKTGFDNGEIAAVAQAIAHGHISQGPEIDEFERQLAAYLGVPYVVTVTSGSAALAMSLWAAGVRPGDEVIVPNRTWIATAHAPLLLGASVRLVDVEAGRPIIDAELIEAAIAERTKAIIPVHICGRSADMRRINEIAARRQLTVIEDASQAFGSRNVDGYLGTQSDMGCFSLSVAKIIATGQGGFIATRNEETYRELVLMRTHGVGSVVNPEWRRPGFNFRFTGLLASIGLVQLGLMAERVHKIRQIYDLYAAGLAGVSSVSLIPVNVGAGEVPVYVEVLCERRDELIDFLAGKGIQCRPFPPDLNHAEYFGNTGRFPRSEVFGERGVNLPAGPDQSLDNIHEVINAIKQFR
jgi:perosamine synthetase